MSDKIFINKNGKDKLTQIELEENNQLKDKYNNLNNSFSQLIEQPINEDYEIKLQTLQDSYLDIRDIIKNEDLISFYNFIETDLPDNNEDQNLQSIQTLDIDFSQGIYIINKDNKINGRNKLFIKDFSYDTEHSFCTWIKPNSKNFKNKFLIRQIVEFIFIETEIVYDIERRLDEFDVTDKYKDLLNGETNVDDLLKELENDLPNNENDWDEQEKELGKLIKELETEIVKNRKKYKIGFYLKVDKDDYLIYGIKFLPVSEFQKNKLSNLESESTLEVKSKNKLVIGNWNFINFGIDNNRNLYLRSFSILDDINELDTVRAAINTNEGLYIQDFMEQVIKDEKSLIPNFEMNSFKVEDFYYTFPPILIGGLENKDLNTNLGNSLQNIKNIHVELNKLKKEENIGQGFKDFQLATIQYFNKYISISDLKEIINYQNIRESNSGLKSNCFIDLDIENIENNKIQDRSGNANHGYLFGDFKIEIFDDGTTDITNLNLPDIKIIEGPFNA